MKVKITIILTLVMVLALLPFTACSNDKTPGSGATTPPPSSAETIELTQSTPPSETSAPENTQQETPENNEYGIHFFVVPDMTEEQQTFYRDYVEKLVYSGLLITNWSADDYSSISVEPSGASNGSYLILAFEDIIGADEMTKLYKKYETEFPAEVIEDVLLKYFPFTTDQLHEILSYHYNAETNTYHYEGGRGGGPIDAAIVNISKGANNEQELIRLDYEFYNGYSGLDYTPNSYLYKTPGVLTLMPNVDGSYICWSVNVGEEVEAPKVN